MSEFYSLILKENNGGSGKMLWRCWEVLETHLVPWCISCKEMGQGVVPAVSLSLGGQGVGAVPRLGFLLSSPPRLNKIPHHSCDALMFFCPTVCL